MAEVAGTVAEAFEASVREQEERWLSPLAVRSYETAGRARHAEEECLLRTPFQRDRDRILHSKPFRRLKGKTQVFIDPAGDHYRTRMTHTLETTGIARAVARALRLNEDLTEAIGLGHDMGHPPFGHAGEEALDACLRARFDRGFRHNEQSSADRGAAQPHAPRCARGSSSTPAPRSRETLEGKIVRIVDRVAYINHDIDDAVRHGILDPADLPQRGDRDPRAARLAADRPARPRPRGGVLARGRHRAERGGRRRDALAARLHVRARLPRAEDARGARARAGDDHAKIFDHLAARGDSPDVIVDYLSGMTDRFALELRGGL